MTKKAKIKPQDEEIEFDEEYNDYYNKTQPQGLKLGKNEALKAIRENLPSDKDNTELKGGKTR